MKFFNSIILILVLASSNCVFAQSTEEEINPRSEMRLGTGLGFGTTLLADPVMIMGRVDFFVLPQIDLEANIGYKFSSVGAKFHINRMSSERLITPFVGTMIGTERGVKVFQVPVGVQLISMKGIYASANISELIYLEYSRFEWVFEFSFGWRFKW